MPTYAGLFSVKTLFRQSTAAKFSSKILNETRLVAANIFVIFYSLHTKSTYTCCEMYDDDELGLTHIDLGM